MTKKTRRILPKGQRPVYGGRAGVLGHDSNCPCRTCRRLRSRGIDRSQQGELPSTPQAPKTTQPTRGQGQGKGKGT